jgi:peptidoglycan hydrolase-like protein with peptidoglycan-binding domain
MFAALAAVVVFAGALAAAPRADAERVGKSATLIEKGDRGPGVRKLQRALGVPADGIFGRGTERALRAHQRRHGLAADGVAGPQTLASLEGRARSRGARGGGRGDGGGGGGSAGVRALQRRLGIAADGAFGPQTEAAVERFQRRSGLAADGVVGPQTRAALGLGPGRTLQRKPGGSDGGRAGLVSRVIRAANRIATMPYRYGGGHGSWRDSGYDCSGSISYALHGAGLLRSPLDSSGLMTYGRPGRGRHVTIYANPGHAYMVVAGRRFDTSARAETGSRWTDTPRSPAGYVARHPVGL